jgi:hypothetical protein
VTPSQAIRRAYVFLAAWLLALVFLPITWVAVSALLYAVALTPGLIEIHRQFQNKPDTY